MITGCGGAYEARGYCHKHYRRLMRHGDVFMPTRADVRFATIKDSYCYIPLGVAAKDGYAIVSLQDQWVEKYKWHKTNSGYAAARINGRLITLHRFILEEPSGGEVDHINRNKLDNRRENLRIVDHSTNSFNTDLRSTNTSGYRGVSYHKAAKKYAAYITCSGKRQHLGLYLAPEDAYKAYLKARNKYERRPNSRRLGAEASA